MKGGSARSAARPAAAVRRGRSSARSLRPPRGSPPAGRRRLDRAHHIRSPPAPPGRGRGTRCQTKSRTGRPEPGSAGPSRRQRAQHAAPGGSVRSPGPNRWNSRAQATAMRPLAQRGPAPRASPWPGHRASAGAIRRVSGQGWSPRPVSRIRRNCRGRPAAGREGIGQRDRGLDPGGILRRGPELPVRDIPGAVDQHRRPHIAHQRGMPPRPAGPPHARLRHAAPCRRATACTSKPRAASGASIAGRRKPLAPVSSRRSAIVVRPVARPAPRSPPAPPARRCRRPGRSSARRAPTPGTKGTSIMYSSPASSVSVRKPCAQAGRDQQRIVRLGRQFHAHPCR